ncbi:hypothetical protein ACB098_05G196000 [Castanea mollissima]
MLVCYILRGLACWYLFPAKWYIENVIRIKFHIFPFLGSKLGCNLHNIENQFRDHLHSINNGNSKYHIWINPRKIQQLKRYRIFGIFRFFKRNGRDKAKPIL